jgi:hypothetical protein
VTFSRNLIENENYFIKDKFLRNIKRVILAKGFHHDSSIEFIKIFEEELAQNFELIIENDQVSVYARLN